MLAVAGSDLLPAASRATTETVYEVPQASDVSFADVVLTVTALRPGLETV